MDIALKNETTKAADDHSHKEDVSAYSDINISRMREIYNNALIALIEASVPFTIKMLKSKLLSIPPASAKVIAELAGDMIAVNVKIFRVDRSSGICEATVRDEHNGVLGCEDVTIKISEIPHYLDKALKVSRND